MSKNTKIHINTENPFVLEDSDKLWMVVSGELNVFYTQLDDEGKYLYPLKHLFTAKKGNLLFSLLTKYHNNKTRLIGFSNKTTLLPIYKHELLNIDLVLLKNMIDKWILKTSVALNQENPPRIYTALDEFSNVTLRKDEVAFSSKQINWISLLKGEINIYAEKTCMRYDDKTLSPIPISNKLWAKAMVNKTEVRVLSTREVMEDEINFLIAFDKLQAHFYSLLYDNLEENKNRDSNHYDKKNENEERKLIHALHNIKSIVTGNRINPVLGAANNKEDGVLFKTCQLIGQNIGITLKEPKHIETYQSNVINQLTAIAKSSKARVRKVILRDTWWKQENGHLLAFSKNKKEPVALIQKSSNSYILMNVATGSELPVNYEIAKEIEPIGYMFFSGFNKKMDSIKEILRFAIQGLKNDAKFLILAAFTGSLVGLLTPILFGVMFDDVIPTADRSLHLEIFAIMIITGLVIAGLHLSQSALQLRVESKSSINLQAGVMDHVLRLPVKFYKNYTAGDMTNRVLSINAIRQIVSNTLITAVLSGVFSFVNLILLFYYDSKLAWIGILLGVIAMAFMIIIGLLKLKYDRKIAENQGEIQGFLFEFLSGITKIRLTGGEKRIFALWADKFSKLKKLGYNSGAYQNLVKTFNTSFPLVTSIVFFSLIYYYVLHSNGATTMISVGAFIAFITAFNKFLNDALRLSMSLIASLNVIPLYERVKPILEAEPESTEQCSDPGELGGDIEMNCVSFRYHEEQPLVLKDVNFKIKQGEMIAFVGASGSGKSTIMRLLLGFEYPETGSIFYDSESFDSMNKELVRRQIGVVLQNGALMSGSIYQNIVGNSELTLDDAWEAAKMAGMEEDIKQMPMEMNTVISEGAGTFSGGQRQRLMIARAIVHKPRLIFMDEATSALDNKTQNIVSESLDRLQATRVVIAHRLSTVKNADRIYVVDKGKIIEDGAFEDLMKLNGVFTQLAKRQIA